MMDIQEGIEETLAITIISVIGTMIIGMFIGRKLLKVNRDTSYLISSGTAISLNFRRGISF